jgi:anti-sigma regulatory factor (Ser/Thr protein kinase)
MGETSQQPAQLEVLIPRTPDQARSVRRQIAVLCAGLSQEVVQVAQLLATELFNNALEHGQGEVSLLAGLRESVLHVEIGDEGPGGPRVGRPTREATRGRGLLLVEEIAAAWGVKPAASGRGKTVWFDLNVPGAARRRG